jgi:hypothetical protein
MKRYDCDQGSPEWFRLRLGKPTASNFHKIITPGGKPSEQSRKYLYRLVAERLLAESFDDPLHLEWVERGKELEPHAAARFSFQHDVELERVGFVLSDDGRLGCSPDRFIKGKLESVEIKCPAPWTHIGYLLDGPGTDYKPQVNGQLLVAELEAVHLYSYSDRMPAHHQISYRDKAYIKTLARYLSDFLERLDEATERARSLGAYVANPAFTTPFDQNAPPVEPLTIVIPE